MWELILKGGPLMGLIIFCSIIAFGVFIERILYLHRSKINTEKFNEEIFNLIKRNRIVEALDKCNVTPGPLAQMVKKGLLKHDRTRQEIREAIEDAAMTEIPKLERNIGVIATIAHIAPLLGLLGTVIGMLKAFQIIEQKAAGAIPVSPGDLAGGIWEALITTMAGIAVAIPTYIAYNYLVARIDAIVSEMERSAVELVDVMSTKRETV